MSVYGAPTRDRQAWLFGLTGPQFFMVLAAGFPTWMAIAMRQWLALLGLVPLWCVVALLICLPIRGHSAFQWIGVLVRHLAGAAFGWSRFQSKAAAGELDLGNADDDADNGNASEADLPGILSSIQIHDGPRSPGRQLGRQSSRTMRAVPGQPQPGSSIPGSG